MISFDELHLVRAKHLHIICSLEWLPARRLLAGSCCPSSVRRKYIHVPPSSSATQPACQATRLNPLCSSSEAIMVTLAPAISGFEHVFGCMHAAGQGKIGLDAPVQDGDPTQGQAQLVGVAQHQVGDDFQLFQVEIGLVKAVEQHQAVCAGLGQSPGEVRQGSRRMG